MSTFYLLPPRPLVGRRFGEYLANQFPGLSWSSTAWPGLAESLGSAAEASGNVYVVYREDFPDGEDAAQVLIHAFGAQPGDEVVEVTSGNYLGQGIRRWRL
jgi:hypothetical protein